jgi:integrase
VRSRSGGLTNDERYRLLAATINRPIINGNCVQLSNRDRVILYSVAMATGLRAEELAVLMPSNFDMQNRCLRTVQTKNGKAAVLPLHGSLVPTLEAWLATKTPSVPLWPGKWFRRAAEMLRKDLAAAGIPAVVDGERADFHSLRHTFVSMSQEAGIEASTRQKLSRHSSLAMVERYTHVPSQSIIDAVARLPLPAIPDFGALGGAVAGREEA